MSNALMELRNVAATCGLGFTNVSPFEMVLESQEDRFHYLNINEHLVVVQRSRHSGNEFCGRQLYKAPVAWVKFNAKTTFIHTLQRIIAFANRASR